MIAEQPVNVRPPAGSSEASLDAPPPPAPASVEEPRGQHALTLIAGAVVVVLLQYMQPILVPFVISGLLFYALDPAVDWLQRVKVPRALGAALTLGIAVGGVVALVLSLEGQALAIIDRLPQGASKLASLFERRPADEPGAIEKVQQAADALQTPAEDAKAETPGVVRVQVEEPRFRASDYLWANSFGALLAFNQAVMILLLTYFMLLSDELLKRKLVEIAGPTLSKKKVTVQILGEIAGQIEQFMMIQVVTSAIVALVTWGALWALGLEQAALWGLLAGIFNTIPYYGPLLVTGGLSVVGFLQFGTVGRTAAVAGVALLITTLEGSILTPAWMGKAAQMNRIAIFAGLLFWSWVWGPWGLLLAVPMMMTVKVVCDHVEDLKPIGHFLGE
jgi:predicted PurR-regulated permease PerM